MGWLGSSRTTTQTQNTTPAWVESAVREGLDAGRAAAQRPFVSYSGPRVAGLDPMQQEARQLAQQNVGLWRTSYDQGQAAAQASMGGVRDITAPTMTAPTIAAPTQQPAAMVRGVRAAPVQGVQAQTAADGMANYANPYQSQVIDAATRAVRRQADQAQAALGQRAAANNAFGGSREAILRGEIERNAQETAGDVAGRLSAQGFETAAGLASQDAARGLQAGMFGAGAFNNAQEAAAGRRQQAGFANANATNDAMARQAAMEFDARRTNADFNADAQRQNATFSMAAQGANQGADTALRDRQLRAGSLFGDMSDMAGRLSVGDVATLEGLGSDNRALQQQDFDARFGEFMREQDWGDERTRMLLSSIYGAPMSLWSSSTTNSRTRDPSALLGGFGSLLQGAGSIWGRG
jgi:hypothetical protein